MPEQASVTFKLSEEMADWVSRTAFDLDKNKSEVIRCCILLSLDAIIAVPSLTNRIQFEDRTSIRQKEDFCLTQYIEDRIIDTTTYSFS